MRSETRGSLFRKRVIAFVSAMAVVAVLWLVALLAVDVLVSSSPNGGGGHQIGRAHV